MGAHGVCIPERALARFRKEFLVEPIVGNFRVGLSRNGKDALCVGFALPQVVEVGAAHSHGGGSLYAVACVRGVTLPHPGFVLACAALPNFNGFRPEQIEVRANSLDSLQVVAGRFRVEILHHAVVIKEHIRESIYGLFLYLHRVVGFVLNLTTYDVKYVSRCAVQRVRDGVVHKSATRIVDAHRARNDRNVRRLDHPAVTRHALG